MSVWTALDAEGVEGVVLVIEGVWTKIATDRLSEFDCGPVGPFRAEILKSPEPAKVVVPVSVVLLINPSVEWAIVQGEQFGPLSKTWIVLGSKFEPLRVNVNC